MLRFFIFLLSLAPFVLTEGTGSTNSSCEGTECQPKTWHNVRCRINDDCDVHHATCYKRVCRCVPGYYYTTHYTCTNTCRPLDLQETFTDYPDSALRANLIHSEDGLTVEVCKGRCLADTRCLTFDFKVSGGLCRLHNVTARQSPSDWSPKRSKGWTHYQRSCQSTLATQDTWDNLLCESRVDCPDTNSDCLSGRCLCRSSFKFNETEKKCVVAKLSKWHSENCSTDDDCDEHHAACYKRVCRCEAGYFYTTQDTCTGTCRPLDLQDSFTEYPDSALRANLIDSEDGLTVEVCKGRCLADTRCLTFDFKANGGLCRLHAVTAHDSPSQWSPKTSKGWTHYQKSCNSTLATHQTWHNLLCHNKIDCPDPYSDCLSGRCVCHFAFNEAEKKCVVASSCVDWQAIGAKSGVYTVQQDGYYYYRKPLTVWCDMDTAGGGWLVFQRRRDFTVDFNRSRTEYVFGFGNISGDFWLGLLAIYDLSWYGRPMRLRVDMVAESGRRYWAQYTHFYVSAVPSFGFYELRGYSGDAGDGLINGNAFRTYDDNENGCVTSTKGPWWYLFYGCGSNANLNSPDRRFVTWANIGRVTFSEMKIKPRD